MDLFKVINNLNASYTQNQINIKKPEYNFLSLEDQTPGGYSIDAVREMLDEIKAILPINEEIENSSIDLKDYYRNIQTYVGEIETALIKKEKKIALLNQIDRVLSSLEQEGISPQAIKKRFYG